MSAQSQAVKSSKNSLAMSGKFFDKLIHGVPLRAIRFREQQHTDSGTPLFWLRLPRCGRTLIDFSLCLCASVPPCLGGPAFHFLSLCLLCSSVLRVLFLVASRLLCVLCG